MAFPAVTGTPVTTAAAGGTGGTFAVSLPSGIVAGETLFVPGMFVNPGSVITAPVGWSIYGPLNGNRTEWALVKLVASGAEGASVSVPRSGTTANSRWAAFRITGTSSFYTSALSSGSSNSPNPPSLSPTGVANDFLWFAFCGTASGVTVFPVNYTVGAVSLPSSEGGVGYRQLNSASEDPGPFTTSGSSSWDAVTYAFGPTLSPGVMAASGLGDFAAMGASTAEATLAASGVGTFAINAVSYAYTSFSMFGLSIVAWEGTGLNHVEWTANGYGSFNVVSVPATPPERVLIVPFESRVLVLPQRSRVQDVPEVDRNAIVERTSRVAIVLSSGGNMPLSWPSKTQGELLDYSLNWAREIGTDVISASSWQIQGQDNVLVEDNNTFTPSGATIWLDGGSPNAQYNVINTIETVGGRTFQQWATIRITASN